jgi:hypothetical protein
MRISVVYRNAIKLIFINRKLYDQMFVFKDSVNIVIIIAITVLFNYGSFMFSGTFNYLRLVLVCISVSDIV